MTAVCHGKTDGNVGSVIYRVFDFVDGSLNHQLAWAPSIVGSGWCFEVIECFCQADRQSLARKECDAVIDALAKVFGCALQEQGKLRWRIVGDTDLCIAYELSQERRIFPKFWACNADSGTTSQSRKDLYN